MGLTLAQLTQAIRRKVDIDMETVVAESIAEHALGFFGFSNRIIDNALANRPQPVLPTTGLRPADHRVRRDNPVGRQRVANPLLEVQVQC